MSNETRASILGRALRLARHFIYDERSAHRVLDAEAQQRLADHVAQSETTHSGEIRLCIEGALPLGYVWRGISVRARAVDLFGQLRVWDTEHNNGVLIYLLLAERRIEIVADRGLAQRVPSSAWQQLADQLAEGLKAGRFEESLTRCIDAVGAMLQSHWALTPGQININELADAPALR